MLVFWINIPTDVLDDDDDNDDISDDTAVNIQSFLCQNMDSHYTEKIRNKMSEKVKDRSSYCEFH